MVKSTPKAKLVVKMAFSIVILAFTGVLVALAIRGPQPTIAFPEHPEDEFHITATGDIIPPSSYTSAVPIERNGNIYNLTGNIERTLNIEKNNVVLNGNGFTANGEHGFKLVDVSNVTVQNLTVRGYFQRVALINSQNNTLQNIITTSIRLDNSNGNLITNIDDGTLTFSSSSNNKIVNCTLHGFELTKSNYNSFLNNNCTSSGASIYLGDSSNNLFFGNTFQKMASWINMQGDSSHNYIVANNITMTPRYYADELTSDNYIYHNNFLAFTWNHTASTPTNVWSSGGRGNYWWDYNGTDRNGDGVGDTPYTINLSNHDDHPLMAPINIATESIPKINP